MANITFKTISWVNFGSYGDHAFSIDFTAAKTTAFTGKNGSGKSTLLDALAFSLYGKPWRKVKKASLVNNKNKRAAKVTITFSAGNSEFKVVRGIKPDTFEIWKDATLLNQDAKARDYQKVLEEEILGISWDAFNQVVVIGKATYTPFMQLDTPRRRAFVESVLGLEVFGEMRRLHSVDNTLADKDLAAKTAALNALTPSLTQARDALARVTAMGLDDMRCEADALVETIDTCNAEIATLGSQRQAAADEVAKAFDAFALDRETRLAAAKASSATIFAAAATVNEVLAEVQKTSQDASNKRAVNAAEVRRLRSDANSVNTATECPSCGSPIDASSAQAHRDKLLEKVKEVEEEGRGLLTAYNEIAAQLTEIQADKNTLATALTDAVRTEREIECEKVEVAPPYRAAREALDSIDAGIASRQQEIARAEGRLSTLITQIERHDAAIAAATRAVADTEANIAAATTAKASAERVMQVNKVVAEMLKDTGIKSTFVRRYIPVINDIVNTELSEMGFFADFRLDENFDDKILSRGFEEMTYNAFSEGEKLRIDMAVLMAWRELCIMTGASQTNLIVMDEILDASFDQEGLEAFMKSLVGRDDIELVCITHHVARIDDFVDRHLVFTKEDGYSKAVESND